MLDMYARLTAGQVTNKFYYLEPHHSRSILNVTCRILDRLRDAMHPVYISRLARDAMDEEESLKNIRLVDLRHDFIIRQLETRPGPMWPGFPALL